MFNIASVIPAPLAISSALTIAAVLSPQVAAGIVIALLVVFCICLFLICLEEKHSFGNGNEINEMDDGREGEEDSESLHLTHSEPIPEKWLDEYVNVPHPLPAVLSELPSDLHSFAPGDTLKCICDSGVKPYIRNGELVQFIRNHTDGGRLIWVKVEGAVKGYFCCSPSRFEKVEGGVEV